MIESGDNGQSKVDDDGVKGKDERRSSDKIDSRFILRLKCVRLQYELSYELRPTTKQIRYFTVKVVNTVPYSTRVHVYQLNMTPSKNIQYKIGD